MNILNCVSQTMHTPTHQIKSKVVFCADHIVNEEIAKQASIGVNLVGLKMDSENVPIESLSSVNMFFTERGKINLEMDTSPLGNYFWLITIHTEKVQNYEPVKILAIIVEELCHHFWSIRDERHVKYKVMEVLNQLYPKLEIDDIFNMESL